MPVSEQDRSVIAQLAAVRDLSHDPDRQVGVLIVDNQGNILSSGSNKPPEAYHYSRADTHNAVKSDPLWKYYMLEHAERNAVINAMQNGVDLHGSTLYGTLFPCADCARAVVAAGVVRVVVPASGLNPPRDQKWREHYEYAQKVFELSGVQVDHYEAD